MEKRKLAEATEQQQYFEAVSASSPKRGEGTRSMGVLYPFIISGGTNTERYYFKHISNTTNHKFNIKPEYFGNEASYPEEFPKRIKSILKNNADAKIFCVFDYDTVYNDKANYENHKRFVTTIKKEIANGVVVLCPSMPSIEYWFLLHFIDYMDLIKSCGTKLQRLLSPYMISFFPNTKKKLLNLLKSEKCINGSEWVLKLCADGKLDDAIKRAECNIKTCEANGDLDKHSYSYVYKVFK